MKRFFPSIWRFLDGALLPKPPPEMAWFVDSMIVLFGMALPHKAPRPALPMSSAARANSKADMRNREVMPSLCLVPFEVAFGVAVGIVEHYGVVAADHVAEGDDDRLLHRGVHYATVDSVARSVVNGDADVAEALVEVDVDRVFVGTSYNGIGGGVCIQISFQKDDFIASWDIVIVSYNINGDEIGVRCLHFASAET